MDELVIGASLNDKYCLATLNSWESMYIRRKDGEGIVLDEFNVIEYLGEGVYHIQGLNQEWSALCFNSFKDIIDFGDNSGFCSSAVVESPMHFGSVKLELMREGVPHLDIITVYRLVGKSGGKTYYGVLSIDDAGFCRVLVPIAYDEIVLGSHLFLAARKGSQWDMYLYESDGKPWYLQDLPPIQNITRDTLEPYPICNGKTILLRSDEYHTHIQEAFDDIRSMICSIHPLLSDYYEEFIVNRNGLFGIWRDDCGLVSPCSFQEIHPCKNQSWDEESYFVRKGTKWGVFSSRTKRMVLNPIFDKITCNYEWIVFEDEGSAGWALTEYEVVLGDKSLYIDAKGDTVDK